MRFIREQIEALEKIDYPPNPAPDFDAFWEKALAAIRAHDPAPVMRETGEYALRHVRLFDARVHGLDGTPVATWVLLPEEATPDNPAPALVHFHGGGCSRGGDPFGWLAMVLAGYAVVVPEFRNQGGITASRTPLNSGIGSGGFATYNLDGPPENHYFYHAFTDQLTVVDFAKRLPGVDAARVAVAGSSQGGGMSLIAAAVNPDLAFCMPAVPSYCAWERRVFTRTACAAEIARYIEWHPDQCDRVFKLLSYFDALNFAGRIRCPVEMSCGLKDESTPPDCVYAGYNRITAPKHMRVLSFGGHTGDSLPVILAALKRHLPV